MRTELCFSRATHLRFKSATAVYFVHRPALDAENFQLHEFSHDRRLIPLPSTGQQAVCPLEHDRRLGPLPPEREATRIFPRKRIPEGRSHSERRPSGSAPHGIGTADGSGASRSAFIPRIPLKRIDGPEPRSFSRAGRLARTARLSRSALEPRVPGAGIPVIGRSGAFLARPTFLQTGTTWRCGGLAPGLFVLDKNHAFGPSHLLDWLGRFNSRKRLLELRFWHAEMARPAPPRSGLGNGWC